MGFFLNTDIKRNIVSLNHYNFHNFAFGTLKGYYHLDTADEVIISNNVLYIRNRNLCKTWVYNNYKDINIDLAEFQELGVIYSQKELPLKGLQKSSHLLEVEYNLQKVLDPASYKNKKKRYQRITYPELFLRKNDIIVEVLKDPYKVKDLHEAWVNIKLSQAKTFKIMFPKKKYWNCINLIKEKDFVGFAAKHDNNYLAAAVFYLEGKSAFDLANFHGYKVNGLAECFNFVIMQKLHKQYNIDVLNYGAYLNTGLGEFKEHWPSTLRKYYIYDKLKEK